MLIIIIIIIIIIITFQGQFSGIHVYSWGSDIEVV